MQVMTLQWTYGAAAIVSTYYATLWRWNNVVAINWVPYNPAPCRGRQTSLVSVRMRANQHQSPWGHFAMHASN
jgi:hypothetical protein